jgi:hypothetical protein
MWTIRTVLGRGFAWDASPERHLRTLRDPRRGLIKSVQRPADERLLAYDATIQSSRAIHRFRVVCHASRVQQRPLSESISFKGDYGTYGTGQVCIVYLLGASVNEIWVWRVPSFREVALQHAMAFKNLAKYLGQKILVI